MSDVNNIKYPDYGYRVESILFNRGTTPVTLVNAPTLIDEHHFVLAWDGKGEPEDTTSVTLGILTSVQLTAEKTRYGVRTCSTNYDLTYDNAVFIHTNRCPEVLVKSETGAFVGSLIGVDYEKGMAVVQSGGGVELHSVSIVTYVDDVNKDLLGIRKAPVEGSDNG